MIRKVIVTADGSRTIHLPDWNENYHSHHGALQEAKHVFIDKVRANIGSRKEISILEMGFGTGLNAFLSLQLAIELQVKINYVALEAFPVQIAELEQLNYAEIWQVGSDFLSVIHSCQWELNSEVHPYFSIHKIETNFENWVVSENQFDFIFFDAFGPRVQPHLWTIPIFSKMWDASKSNGIFLTYCAKGQVRRDLQSIGFEMKRIPGPPGKREMLIGFKS